MNLRRNQIRGSIVGGAVGDALGYAIEFSSYASIQHAYGEKGITRYELNEKGEAEISDDTQMTLFTANGLMLGITRGRMEGIMGGLSFYVKLAYLEWYDTQTGNKHTDAFKGCWLSHIPELYSQRAPGTTCLSALSSIKQGQIPNNHSKGCGGVMRVAPVGLFCAGNQVPLSEAIKLGGDVAALTHLHPLGYLPAAVMAGIIYQLVGREHTDVQDLETILGDVMSNLYEVYPDVHPYIDELKSLIERAVALSHDEGSDVEHISKLGEGWVGDEALAIAIYCTLKHFGDFEQAIIAAVNHSGDSDSTGSICGNIIGVLVGFDAIPDYYKEHLELRPVMEAIADDLSSGCCISESVKRDTPEKEQWFSRYCEAEPSGL